MFGQNNRILLLLINTSCACYEGTICSTLHLLHSLPLVVTHVAAGEISLTVHVAINPHRNNAEYIH